MTPASLPPKFDRAQYTKTTCFFGFKNIPRRRLPPSPPGPRFA